MSHPSDPAQLSDREQATLDAIDESWLIETLSSLLEIPSVGGAEDDAQHLVADVMRGIGLHVDEWDIDVASVAQHPDYSAEVTRNSAVGVVGSTNGVGPTLMLNGHIDVVPVGDSSRWTVNPWEPTVRNGRIYGRGACDMKGGLTCALAAVRAVLAAGIDLAGAVTIASVVGEEDGGLGTLATLLRGHTADAAVVVEPTNLEIAPVQAGSLGFRLTVAGSPAHGALRTEGVSAITKTQPVLSALRTLEATRNARFSDPLFSGYAVPYALSIGTMIAGEWASTVPDTLVAEGRYGIAPGESVAAARREFEQAVAAVAMEDEWLRTQPPRVEWRGGQFLPGATPTDAPIVAAVADAHTAVGGAPASIIGVPYGSDLRHLVNVGGIPSVLYGPGDVRLAHREDEFVPVSDLVHVTRTLALLVARWSAGR